MLSHVPSSRLAKACLKCFVYVFVCLPVTEA